MYQEDREQLGRSQWGGVVENAGVEMSGDVYIPSILCKYNYKLSQNFPFFTVLRKMVNSKCSCKIIGVGLHIAEPCCHARVSPSVCDVSVLRENGDRQRLGPLCVANCRKVHAGPRLP